MAADHRHPLVVAARAGDVDAIAILVADSDPDYVELALEEAVRADQGGSVEALLAAGTEVTGPALQFAIERPALLARLLATAPSEAALDAALASALIADRSDVVDLLLAAGLPREWAVAGARKLGSDLMRAHLGLPKRRRRR